MEILAIGDVEYYPKLINETIELIKAAKKYGRKVVTLGDLISVWDANKIDILSFIFKAYDFEMEYIPIKDSLLRFQSLGVSTDIKSIRDYREFTKYVELVTVSSIDEFNCIFGNKEIELLNKLCDVDRYVEINDEYLVINVGNLDETRLLTFTIFEINLIYWYLSKCKHYIHFSFRNQNFCFIHNSINLRHVILPNETHVLCGHYHKVEQKKMSCKLTNNIYHIYTIDLTPYNNDPNIYSGDSQYNNGYLIKLNIIKSVINPLYRN